VERNQKRRKKCLFQKRGREKQERKNRRCKGYSVQSAGLEI